jgi:hypothetical protein
LKKKVSFALSPCACYALPFGFYQKVKTKAKLPQLLFNTSKAAAMAILLSNKHA